ncbi:MAG TPA: hypothetical protein VF789_12655 [Thermoanaerobaculia bacterium]
MSSIPRFVLRLSLLLLAAPVWAQETPPAPALPKGVEALEAETSRKMDELLAAAEKFRGLKAKRPVAAGSVGAQGVKDKMRETMRTQLPPETLKSVEVSLKAFGFIPEKMDLGRYYVELMGSQVAGFYDPEADYMALVRPSGKGSDDPLAEMVDMVLVHELTHALQDQHFDLSKFEGDDPMADAGTARGALVEGDATLTMMSFMLGLNIETLPGFDRIMDSMMKSPEALFEASPDLPGTKELAAAPVWIRENLLFGYIQGMVFSLSTRSKGGQKLLDYAFTTDPPRSTEQILHPEKWHSRRDDPVAFRLPDLGAELPGYRKAAEGEMGELSVRILLREGLRKQVQADAAAAGWGGDRFAVYEKGSGRIVVWVTEWDTEEDAREALAALRSLRDGWRAEAAGPRRVLVTRGALKGERLEAVRVRLAAVTAERPANKDLDLAAIGAEPPKMDEEGLKKMLDSPVVKEGLEDLSKANEEKPEGAISRDGRSYKNRGLGFSIALPEGTEEWSLEDAPEGGQALLMIFSPDQKARVTVIHQALPGQVPAEEMGGMLELGMKTMVPGYNRLRGEMVEKGDARVMENWFEAAPDGTRWIGVMRFYLRASEVFGVLAMAPADSWPEHEKATLDVLNTFTLEPKRGKP